MNPLLYINTKNINNWYPDNEVEVCHKRVMLNVMPIANIVIEIALKILADKILYVRLLQLFFKI